MLSRVSLEDLLKGDDTAGRRQYEGGGRGWRDAATGPRTTRGLQRLEGTGRENSALLTL